MTPAERAAKVANVAAAFGIEPDAVEDLLDLLRQPSPAQTAPTLIDATDVAERFGKTRDWVYDHADDLGAVRLGDGPRPRLAFDSQRVAAYIDGQVARPTPPPTEIETPRPRRRRRRREQLTPADVQLLPIGSTEE